MPARVVILGGGVAGMSAAQELIERGFEVVVLEKNSIAGGKARSIPVSDDDGRTSGHEVADTGIESVQHNLPGEHGFRFFPGFYKHVVDTMRRIPSFDDRMVADHLVPTTRVAIAQYDKPLFEIPASFPRTPADAGTVLRDVLVAFSGVTELTPDDLAHFGLRLWQIMTSSAERRIEEYEKIGWWEFVGAETRSHAYQKFLAAGITRSLVAAKARTASTRTIGDVFVQLVMTILNPVAGSTDRVLDGPTNLVWVDPWLSYLRSRGVDYRFGAVLKEIRCADGRIAGAVVAEDGGQRVVEGDYYVCALPIECVAPLVSEEITAVDPALAKLPSLAPNVEWMNGLQFYLTRDIHEVHGHSILIDTEWALTTISQLQFWRSMAPEEFGDPSVRGVISVDISDWTAAGLNGRAAKHCSREEVARETWEQIKRSLIGADVHLNDEDLHSWFLDPDIQPDPDNPGTLCNAEPLLVNRVNTWRLRPEATTGIPNLFLASDYVRTNTDLATMEGANEAARRAVNGILDAEGIHDNPCDVWPLHEPDVFAPWRLYDAARHEAGLPWDDSLRQVAEHALRGASPILDQVRPLLATVSPFATPVAAALEATTAVAREADVVDHFDPSLVPGSDYLPTPQYPRVAAADVVPGAADIVGPGGFLDRLDWYQEKLSDTLIGGIPAKEPQKHLYGLIADFLGRSGKGLRPALCMASTAAHGGNIENAVPAAAGIEMLHNAFLVHDDVEDGSESRRGAPTMHRRVGTPIAVNTGDAMNALAMRHFLECGKRLGPEGAVRLMEEVDHMLIESLEGQAMELGWVRDNDLSVKPEDYLRMVLKKTAWYSFIHPMRIGALVARPDDDDLSRFDRFGYLLGLAFQIQDDVLNLEGTKARYGKEICGDLLEGKRTLMLTRSMSKASAPDREWMSRFLAQPRERRLPREVHRLRDTLIGDGSIEWAKRSAEDLVEAATREFDQIAFADLPAGPDLEWLRSCIAFLVRRDA